MALAIINKPTPVEYEKLKCLILDAPTSENLETYIKAMLAYDVRHLVRTCESSYHDYPIEMRGIKVHDLTFPDGESPPDIIIDRWLKILSQAISEKGSVAVHCVAGLGRAPVLVAIGLVECGLDPMDAISFVREKRNGAISRRQLQFLKAYKPRKKKRRCMPKSCTIM